MALSAVQIQALRFRRAGLRVFPLQPARPGEVESGKHPRYGLPWKEYQPALREILVWGGHEGLGLQTGAPSGIVVIDCDSVVSARLHLLTHGPTPVMSRTIRGVHFWYRHPGEGIRIPNRQQKPPFDVRGDGGYVVAPPTCRAGGQYRFLPGREFRDLDQLRPLPADLLEAIKEQPVEVPKPPPRKPSEPLTDYIARRQERTLEYVAAQQAISGQGGHNVTWNVACSLVEVGLSEEECWATLAEWNRTNASPPWSEKALRHKLNDALRLAERIL